MKDSSSLTLNFHGLAHLQADANGDVAWYSL